MKAIINRNYLPYLGLIIIAFSIPLFKKMISPVIGLSLLFVLFNLKSINFKLNFVKNKHLILYVLFYLIVLVSLFWSDNINEGLFDLEVKLSFVVFPFLFWLLPTNIDKDKFDKILKSFIYGLILAIVICYIIALVKFINKPIFYYTFVGSKFSFFHHPTYFSLYINLALIIVLKWYRNKSLKPISAILLSLFFLVTNWLLMSRSGLLISALIVSAFFVNGIYRKKFYETLFIFFMIVSSVILITKISNYTIYRVSSISVFVDNLLIKKQLSSDEAPQDSRFATWLGSIDYIKKKPFFGAGSGDVHTVLNDYYKSNNLNVALERGLNSHNQFLQTWVATGIIGLILLCLFFILPIFMSLKTEYRFIVFGFYIMMIITMLIESTFETQSGVVYFCFFSCLFYYYHNNLIQNQR